MNIFKEKGITHLDLHGIKHHDVNNEVLDFIYQYQSEIPLISDANINGIAISFKELIKI